MTSECLMCGMCGISEMCGICEIEAAKKQCFCLLLATPLFAGSLDPKKPGAPGA